MKYSFFTICAAAILLAGCNNSGSKTTPTDSTATKTDSAIAKAPPMDSAAVMKAWADFATPGAMHSWMAKTNGTWEGDITEFSNPAAPSKSKATNVQTMVLGGRYAHGKYSGNMMGQPFEGMTIMGYDNGKKMFVSTWIDNMGTGIVQMSGTYDEATKTLHMKGKQTDATTGKDCDIREDMTMIDDNTYTMTMYGSGLDGKEAKFMEGKFTKKK